MIRGDENVNWRCAQYTNPSDMDVDTVEVVDIAGGERITQLPSA